MTINFKKVSALATSALLVGLTMGTAMAATYPAPFVSGSSSNVAIVYGATADAMDSAQADKIELALGGLLTGTGATTIVGGEAFKLEKSSDKFNFGDAMNSIYSSLDNDELTTSLEDGTYKDGDVDTDYSQKITLKAEALTLFKDSDYNDEKPTIGFVFTKNDAVLDYELDFDTAVPYADLVETDMPLLGSEYFVLSTSGNNSITLLNSAEQKTLELGETATVNGKEVTVQYVGTTSAKFKVGDETTDSISEGDDYELDDGSYIVVKDAMTSSKESVADSVEFYIGSEKLVLTTGEKVEMNEEDIDGLTVTLTNSGNDLDKITLAWTAPEDAWLTTEDALTMPGFGRIGLDFKEITFPESPEKIEFSADDSLILDMGSWEIPLYQYNASTTNLSGILGDSDNSLIVDADALLVNLTEGDRFLVTLVPTSKDLSDAETRYYEVSSIQNDSDDIEVKFDDLIGSNNLILDDADATDDGDITFHLNETVDDAWTTLNMTTTTGTISMSKIISEKGAVLSFAAPIVTVSNTTGVVNVTEADKEGNINSGDLFNITIGIDTTEGKLEVTNTNVTTIETSTEDVYEGYVTSELATYVNWDKSADLAKFYLNYYGGETTADVQVIVGGEASASGDTTSALGDVIVKDTEVEAVKTKNLIVVGGSCVNSVAATLLGKAACGADFTAATTIGSGQFLIQSFANPYASSKIALLVAGYEKEDTANAATYLLNNDNLDITAGKKWKSTSAIAASLVSSQQ